MAKPSCWVPHLEAFVDSSRSSDQQDAGLDAITALVKKDILTIEELVRGMELYLTTSDNVLRARGILLLAVLLTRLTLKPLDNATIHSLISFFTSRLADWQALRGALIGCLALLRRKSNVGKVLTNDARLLAKSFLLNVQVQSLAQQDRKLCFELLECLLDCYPDAVVPLGDDLIYGISEAIDEEKDPHCLMLTFHLVQVLGQLFSDPSGPLASYARDLFEILGRYFPIYFTHPKSDDLDVKRDDLSLALMRAFSSTPFFEPFAIPLLLEKLSSSLPLAKLDSLKYLSNCILHYGADRMLKHANTIWYSLREVIFASSQEPLSVLESELLGDATLLENEVANGALLCLQRLIFQLEVSGDNLFVGLIIDDEDLETVFRSLITGNNYKDITVEGKQKLSAVASVFSVLAKVSSVCCSRVFQKCFPDLMNTLGISQTTSSNCISNGNFVLTNRTNTGALFLCVELLAACRDLAANSEVVPLQSPPGKEAWFSLLQNCSGPLADALGSMLVTTRSEDAEETDVLCVVKGLQILATFPWSFILPSNAVYENILMVLVSVVVRKWEEKFPWKLALKALVQIGTCIEKFDDLQKGKSYVNIVVEKIISLLSNDFDANVPLKLEAICKIGTIGLRFMLMVVQGLEEAISTNFSVASVDGDLKSTEFLFHLLESYSCQVLPWFDKHGGFEEVAMHFIINIWDLLDNSTTFSIGAKGQVLLNSTMKAMKLAVGGCTVEKQGLIVRRTSDTLSWRTLSLLKESVVSSSVELEGFVCTQDLFSLSCRDEWLISLFASVVIALHPQTPLPDVRAVLDVFLMFVLLKGHIPAAQALGSVINKWDIKAKTTEALNSFSLDEALDMILNMGPQSFLDNNPSSHCDSICGSMAIARSLHAIVCNNFFAQTNAIVGISWIGKGLAMRGHEKVKEITILLLKCLTLNCESRTMAMQQDVLVSTAGQEKHLLARAAADAFHVLLSDSEVCLNKNFHASIRPLYKQYFFFSILPIMLSLIKESNLPNTRAFLFRAFGYVLSETPLLVLVTEAKKVIPLLLNAIAVLSLDVLNKDLTYSLLLVLSGILMDENGKEAITENAHAIINHLIGLVSYQHMMLVRETAIQCLVVMSELPHVTIYPLRPQILQALSKALDDPKRSVRQEAARCCQAWASTMSRSSFQSGRLK